MAAKLATVVVTTGYTAGHDYTGAAQVQSGYDGLLASGCTRLHERWWTTKGAVEAGPIRRAASR